MIKSQRGNEGMTHDVRSVVIRYPFTDKHGQEFAALGLAARTRLVDGEMFCWTGSRLRLAADYFRMLVDEAK
ncbi:hypothetical protein [Endozoicomonas sp. SCSIO W0465]|uniref:hypothetical protein n=1 Tax=Endozoicomonas sp. SCSIO W0465 TaxID=2918516 RepID=UPI002075F0BD|nr:hypothetical protein [Endozoicomonas sp. SCSIO W0465]USE36084.1 hypothetical protein MJO57_29245 [Endozoicomonas sp. SCSIO W0465]